MRRALTIIGLLVCVTGMAVTNSIGMAFLLTVAGGSVAYIAGRDLEWI